MATIKVDDPDQALRELGALLAPTVARPRARSEAQTHVRRGPCANGSLIEMTPSVVRPVA